MDHSLRQRCSTLSAENLHGLGQCLARSGIESHALWHAWIGHRAAHRWLLMAVTGIVELNHCVHWKGFAADHEIGNCSREGISYGGCFGL